MTILAPGTPYWEVIVDGAVVYEDSDKQKAEDVLWEWFKRPDTRNVWAQERVTPASGSGSAEAILGPSEGRGAALERLPAKVAARAKQHVPAVLEPAPRYDEVYQEAVERMDGETPTLVVTEAPTTTGPLQSSNFRGRLTATSWEPPKPDMSIEDWLAEVALLLTMRDRLQWAIGDSLLFGEVRYGEAWSQVADQYNHHTLENCRWVASRFAVSRRRENLSFSHHAEVASMEPPDQDGWLDRAEAEGMHRAELRKALKGEVAELEMHDCPSCGRSHRIL